MKNFVKFRYPAELRAEAGEEVLHFGVMRIGDLPEVGARDGRMVPLGMRHARNHHLQHGQQHAVQWDTENKKTLSIKGGIPNLM